MCKNSKCNFFAKLTPGKATAKIVAELLKTAWFALHCMGTNVGEKINGTCWSFCTLCTGWEFDLPVPTFLGSNKAQVSLCL